MSDPQNIYDNQAFFSGYKKLRDNPNSLNDTLEQPAFWSLVPENLTGFDVLDLGCGFGSFARKARALGAAHVLAIDVSENMLTEARRRTHDPQIDFRQATIEDLLLPECAFDLIGSSLMLHYVDNYRAAIDKIAASLKPGGRFVFSVEHPILTALPQQDWTRDSSGIPLHWPVDNYRPEGPRHTTWFVNGVVKYHRTLETYVNTLLDKGFALERLLEPAPLDVPSPQSEIDLHRRRPLYLLIAARH